MPETKYDKYILSGPRPWNPPGTGAVVAFVDDRVNDNAYFQSHQYYIHWVPKVPQGLPGVSSWEQMGHGPHKHKYPEVVMHLGTDPDNPLDLGGEVEFCLGPEMEKHILTTSNMVYLPADFIHGPWIIRKVTRPFIMVTVEQCPTHTEMSFQDMVSDEERDNLLFIDQGYKSEERVLKLAKKMKREW
ncbi:MAG: hypothetical protein A2Y58_03550 [Chloroflexi bacterium RBG_13_51_52]|nr:MAG: hypothetical protein A2Y58_03550 [Chloroflexi bacterium RBG_13_51_52]